MSGRNVHATSILVLGLLSLCNTAAARLGENRAESDKRYGAPAQNTAGPSVLAEFGPADSTSIYVVGTLQIEAFFWKGKTCRIRYTKSDSSILDEANVAQLLKSEAGAGKFLSASKEFASRFYNYDTAWRRSDGKVLVGKFVLFMDFFDADYFREWYKPKGLPGNI